LRKVEIKVEEEIERIISMGRPKKDRLAPSETRAIESFLHILNHIVSALVKNALDHGRSPERCSRLLAFLNFLNRVRRPEFVATVPFSDLSRRSLHDFDDLIELL
jgi:hypothetical protein